MASADDPEDMEITALALTDIPWDDVLYRTLFPMLPWRSLFYLRGTCRDTFNCVNQYLEVCRRVNLIQTGPRMNAATFNVITGRNQSIRILFLRNFKDWLVDAVVCPVIEQNMFLAKLDITNCSTISNQTVMTAANKCRQLEELKMRDCPWLTPEAIMAVAHGCPQLSHLDIAGCWNINDDAVILLSVACKKLTYLSVARVYGVTDRSIGLVARNCAELRHLNMQGCWRVTNQAVTQLGEYCRKLHILQVRDCRDINEMSLARIRVKGIRVDVQAKKWELGEDMSKYLGKINLNLQI